MWTAEAFVAAPLELLTRQLAATSALSLLMRALAAPGLQFNLSATRTFEHPVSNEALMQLTDLIIIIQNYFGMIAFY